MPEPEADRQARIRELVLLVSDEAWTLDDVAARESELYDEVRLRVEQMNRLERELSQLWTTTSSQELVTIGSAAKAAASSFSQLTEIEGYELQDMLGAGGMGLVYRARHCVTERIVAIKTVHLGAASRATELERFHQEYRLLARLNHPRIVQVYEVGVANGQPYFSMEFLEGGSLEQQLDDQPCPSRKAATLIKKIAEGVRAAHQEQIIHRDLKPANVLLTREGEPKVSDFGLARLLGNEASMTLSGMAVGTPHYMAPEQISGSRGDLTPAADVYALGAILYRLLTGRVPHAGESTAETLRQLLHEEPIAPSRLNSRVERDLETICLKCLEKNPHERYSSAAQLEERLTMYLSGIPIPEQPITWIERTWRWSKRNRKLASALAASALLLVILIIVSVSFAIIQTQNSNRLSIALREARVGQVLSQWDIARKTLESGELATGLSMLSEAQTLIPAEDHRLRASLALDEQFWAARNHRLERSLPHDAPFEALSISSDGKRCATLTADHQLRIWNTGNGQLLHSRAFQARALTYLRDSQWLALCNSDRLELIETATDKRVEATLENQTHGTSITMLGQQDILIVGCDDGSLQFWKWSRAVESQQLPELKCLHTFKGEMPVNCVACTRDGQLVAIGTGKPGGKEGQLLFLKVTSRENKFEHILLRSEEFEKPVRAVAFTVDEASLIVGDENWETQFWDVENVERLRSFAVTDQSHGQVRSIICTEWPTMHGHEQVAMLAAYDSNQAMFWSVSQLRDHWQTQKGGLFLPQRGPPRPLSPLLWHPDQVTHVGMLSNDGNRFVTACDDGQLRIWCRADAETLDRSHQPSRARIRSVAVHPTLPQMASAGQNGQIFFWDHRADQPIFVIDCGEDVRSIAYIAGGDLLLSGTVNGNFQLWDTITGKPTTAGIKRKEWLTMFSISHDCQRIFAGVSGSAQMFQLPELSPIGPKYPHCDDPSLSVTTAISPDGTRVLTGGQDKTACLWHIDGTLIARWPSTHEILACAFSPSGKLAATSGGDGLLRIWDAKSGDEVATIRQSGAVYAIEFSSDDHVLCGHDLGLQWWDIPHQRKIGPEIRTGHEIMAIAEVSPWVFFGDSRSKVALQQMPNGGNDQP